MMQKAGVQRGAPAFAPFCGFLKKLIDSKSLSN